MKRHLSTFAGGAAALVGTVVAAGILGQMLRRTRVPRTSGRRILYLGTGQIAQVFPRNGVNLFLERECSDFDGFFEELWNVHFPAGSSGALDLTPRHHLVDFDLRLPGWLARFRRLAMVAREVAFLGWLVPFALRNRVSVITATNPYLQGLNAAIATRTLGIPYALIITRDYDWDWNTLGKQAFPSVFPSRSAEKRVEGWVLRNAALVLADREYYRDYAVRNGAPAERTIATRVLADSAYEQARPASRCHAHDELAGSGPLLTYVGRLDRDKLAMDLVEILARVRTRFPHAQLVCAGDGSLAGAMRERARALSVQDGLHLVGALPLDRVSRLLATSDVVAAAHMGYTLVEAGLTGVPIATYDYDWHREVIEDARTGLLAPLSDHAALGERICSVLWDPGLASSIGARARRRMLREHTLDAVVPRYRAAYAQALS